MAREEKATIRPDGVVDSSGEMDAIPWWSFTKTALAVALLRLSEEGLIDLDSPIEGKAFTPAQLLRHEAGLADYGSLPAYHADVASGCAPWSIESLMEAVDADRLLYRPGKGWAYSNIGYFLVARLIEEASNRDLANALADLVFAPAKLDSARLAVSPHHLLGVNMGDATGYHPGWVYHGLIVGTALDAAKLLDRLLRGKLMSAESLRRMLEPISLPQFRSERHPDPGYGLGLMLHATAVTEYPAGHSGSGPGSSIAVYSRRGTTCAAWATSSSGVVPETEVFRALSLD